ncbi:MAG TPA: carboxypeptidase-like regulatory domain-containing protein [Blastocatellia bacterium]|nr:carboxypeptidase-like regulatory domain-containing protein [Blastocatellia bacterium]
MIRTKFAPFFLSLLASLVLLLQSAGAQTATGRIVGTVQDSSGAIIPNATVTALNEATSISYRAVTNTAGNYNFEALLAGTYTITVEVQGFKKFTTSKNILTANDTVTINIALEAGNISEVVQVEGSYERVQTSQSGNLGNLVNQKTVTTLPINGRNPLNLVLLQPGVVEGANTGGGTHIFGARDRAINTTLDGIDANETSASTATSTPIRTNPDSLQEYRVITSNPSAEFGRNSGAQVALITRSGTNQFHGTLFEFHRNRVLNANEWELNRQKFARTDPRCPGANCPFNRRFLLRNQFGGSIGGPVIKNKLFFFFNTQWQRQTQTLEQTNTVYTQQARQGVFRYVVGGRNFAAGTATPSVDAQGNPLPNLTIGTYNAVTNDPRNLGLDPTVQKILALTPLPNRFDVGDGLNTAGYTWLATRTDPQRDFNVKIDYTLNDRNSFFGRYSWGQQDTVGDTTNSGAARFPGLPAIVATYRTPKNLAIGWRSTLNNSTTNELIAGGNKFLFDFAIPSNQDSRTTPIVTVNPTDPLSNSYGNLRELTTYQIVDNMTHVRGAHTLRFGLNLRLQRHYDVRGTVAGLDVNPRYLLGGAVEPTAFRLPTVCSTTITTNCMNVNDRTRTIGLINDMLGKLNRVDVGLVARGNTYAPPGTPFLFDAWFPEYDFYFQDDWKIRPNLTLNIGMRYEPKPKPYARGENKIFAPDRPFVAGAAPSTALRYVNADLYQSDLDNWSPAIGIAWDPTRSGKMSVRGNFRIAYDRMSTFLPSSAVFPNVPGITLAMIDATLGQRDYRLRDGIPSLVPPASSTPFDRATPSYPGLLSQEVLDPNFVSPKTYMWSFGVQRDVGKGIVVDAQYIGRAGRNLIGGYERNQVELRSNGFLAAFNTAKAGGESTLLDNLTRNHPNRTATQSGAAFLRSFFAADLTNNNVASVASALNRTLITSGGVQRILPDVNGFGPFFFTPYPQILGGMQVIDSNSFSNYHGALIQVQRRFAAGLEFQASYTFSKSLDDKSYDPTFTRISSGTGQTATSTPLDVNDRALTYGISDFDRTHVIQANGIYNLPFGIGKKFGSNVNGFVDRLIGGWTITGIVLRQSGRPFTVVSGTNSFSNASSSRAVYTGNNFKPQFRDDPTTGVPFIFTPEERAKFSLPAAGDYGNIARNAFRMPWFFSLDGSVIKQIRLGTGDSSWNLELRGEAFNLTNTKYYSLPSVVVNTPASLGRSLGTSTSARIIQVAAKLNF